MHKKLLISLSLIAGQAMAMEPGELIIPSEQGLPTNTAEKMVTILLQQGETKELRARYSSLSNTLKNLGDDLAEANNGAIPLPEVSLETWQHIENQLGRVYRSTQGETQLRDEIIAAYAQLDSTSLIALIGAVEYLDIPLLKEIAVEVAHNKLTLKEVSALPANMYKEALKLKACRTIASPLLAKQVAVFKGDLTPFTVFPLSFWRRSTVSSVCVSSDGKLIMATGKTIRVCDRQGQERAVCNGHTNWVTSVCITTDNKIVSGSLDGTIRMWDIDGTQLGVFGVEGMSGVWSVCVTPDGAKIVSGCHDGTVHIWNRNGNELAVCRGPELAVLSVCARHDNKVVVSRFFGGTFVIWDIDGTQVADFRVEGGVNAVCVTQDNKFVSGSKDGIVRIWDMNGNQQAVCCRGHEGEVTSVCATQDNKIVSGSRDGTVRIWDMFGNQLAVCRGHEGAVRAVCATPDGTIVSASDDGTVRLWDISLLDRFAGMNEEQAQAICKILGGEQRWKEIHRVFDEQGSNARKWLSGEALKVIGVLSIPLVLLMVSRSY